MDTTEAFEHLYSTYFGENQHERHEIENLPNLLVGCDLFVDAGASLGMYTYFANEAMDGGTIIAVEADPDRFEELKRNCEKWEAEGTNTIRAIHAAMGDARTPITFFKTGTQISGGFFPVNERSEDYQAVEVQQILLDDLYQPDVPTLVKIDVEGAEQRVLLGAQKHLSSGTTRLLLEFHWWGDRERGYTNYHVLRHLHGARFSIHKTTPVHTSNYHLVPTSPGERVIGGYLKVAPLLLAKSIYGRYTPNWLRDLRERRLNRRRRRLHGVAASGDR